MTVKCQTADPIETVVTCSDRGQSKQLLSVPEAVNAAISVAFPVTGVESLALVAASGRILARPVMAGCNLPRFDHSAMDGYAVRSQDLHGVGPWTFSVVGGVAAGDMTSIEVATAGTAVAINTGAPVPPGYDAVLVNETCLRTNEAIVTAHRPRRGENIRVAGEDIKAGTVVAAAGTLVTPHVAALLAGLGMANIDVLRRVRVALITTGTELKQPGEALASGQIYDSNRFLVRAMLDLPWISLADAGSLTDHFDSIRGVLRDLSRDHDVVISTGGMSSGAADHVWNALQSLGASMSVLNVAMRPGKPAMIGRVGSALFVGLPGNPMAAAIALRQIALPGIHVTGGRAPVDPEWFPARSGFACRKRPGRTEFIPVRISGRDDQGMPILEALGRGSSGSLSPMARADGIAVLPPNLSEISEGMRLRYEPFGTTH
ncbi:gephyrin-like molybdotransferase Glp [Ensifer adhaerens]|uniref:molybdopterin molybdotransferase MoeA n=1 Tax=Ensifer adhaerens TaxID=106592 RepID=UPI003B831D0C